MFYLHLRDLQIIAFVIKIALEGEAQRPYCLFALGIRLQMLSKSFASPFCMPVYSGRYHFVAKQIRSVPRPVRGDKYII